MESEMDLEIDNEVHAVHQYMHDLKWKKRATESVKSRVPVLYKLEKLVSFYR
jgi:hypothetical protein